MITKLSLDSSIPTSSYFLSFSSFYYMYLFFSPPSPNILHPLVDLRFFPKCPIFPSFSPLYYIGYSVIFKKFFPERERK